MTEELAEYIRERVGQKYRLIEAERQRKQDEESPEPCFLSHGGRWDVDSKSLIASVEESVVSVVRDRKSAEVLVDAVFNEARIYASDSGGDHHTGHFEDYSVSTERLRLLAGDPAALRKVLDESAF